MEKKINKKGWTKMQKNIRCFIFKNLQEQQKNTKRKMFSHFENGSLHLARKYNIWFQHRWWWKKKNSFKCKNRKITFLVRADRTYLLHFHLPQFSFLYEIWCLNVCSSIQPLIKTFIFLSFFSAMSWRILYCTLGK